MAPARKGKAVAVYLSGTVVVDGKYRSPGEIVSVSPAQAQTIIEAGFGSEIPEVPAEARKGDGGDTGQANSGEDGDEKQSEGQACPGTLDSQPAAGEG